MHCIVFASVVCSVVVTLTQIIPLLSTKVTGPGKIWIQSLSIDKMRKLFPPKVIQQDSNNTGNVDGPTDA
jgi:hypothetical protein